MIKGLLRTKAAKGYKTTFVVTMLDQGAPDSAEEFARLCAAFKGLDVYAYHKSVDTRWYLNGTLAPTKSLHWSRPCLHAWCSTTVLADGSVQACMETFDTDEFNLGNANESSLADIWNGQRYSELRWAHLTGEGLPHKCLARCDMHTVGGLRA
jgi:radical SAM protein with 4Fe4S-binding SPASM domain